MYPNLNCSSTLDTLKKQLLQVSKVYINILELLICFQNAQYSSLKPIPKQTAINK